MIFEPKVRYFLNGEEVTDRRMFFAYIFANSFAFDLERDNQYINPLGELRLRDSDNAFASLENDSELVMQISYFNPRFNSQTQKTLTLTAETPERFLSADSPDYSNFTLIGKALGDLDQEIRVDEEGLNPEALIELAVDNQNASYEWHPNRTTGNVIFNGTKRRFLNDIIAYADVYPIVIENGHFSTILPNKSDNPKRLTTSSTDVLLDYEFDKMRGYTRDGISATVNHVGENREVQLKEIAWTNDEINNAVGTQGRLLYDTIRLVVTDFPLGFENIYLRLDSVLTNFSNTLRVQSFESDMLRDQNFTWLDSTDTPWTSRAFLQMRPALGQQDGRRPMFGIPFNLLPHEYDIVNTFYQDGNKVDVIDVPIYIRNNPASSNADQGFNFRLSASERAITNQTTTQYGNEDNRTQLPPWFRAQNISLAEQQYTRRQIILNRIQIQIPLQQQTQEAIVNIMQIQNGNVIDLTLGNHSETMQVHGIEFIDSNSSFPRLRLTLVSTTDQIAVTQWILGVSRLGVDTVL